MENLQNQKTIREEMQEGKLRATYNDAARKCSIYLSNLVVTLNCLDEGRITGLKLSHFSLNAEYGRSSGTADVLVKLDDNLDDTLVAFKNDKNYFVNQLTKEDKQIIRNAIVENQNNYKAFLLSKLLERYFPVSSAFPFDNLKFKPYLSDDDKAFLNKALDYYLQAQVDDVLNNIIDKLTNDVNISCNDITTCVYRSTGYINDIKEPVVILDKYIKNDKDYYKSKSKTLGFYVQPWRL